jgi:hypothetical protein
VVSVAVALLLLLIAVFASKYLFDQIEQQWKRCWFLKATNKEKNL